MTLRIIITLDDSVLMSATSEVGSFQMLSFLRLLEERHSSSSSNIRYTIEQFVTCIPVTVRIKEISISMALYKLTHMQFVHKMYRLS